MVVSAWVRSSRGLSRRQASIGSFGEEFSRIGIGEISSQAQGPLDWWGLVGFQTWKWSRTLYPTFSTFCLLSINNSALGKGASLSLEYFLLIGVINVLGENLTITIRVELEVTTSGSVARGW